MDAKRMTLDPECPVSMSNDLIKSKSTLSLNEIKLLRLAIMNVMKGDGDFQTWKVGVKELASLLGIDRHGIYQEIDRITTDLMREIVYVGDGDPTHKWKKFQWCSYCEYDGGTITIRLHDQLKPYLLHLSKMYTTYMLEEVITLKSVHAIRLWELIRAEMMGAKVYADRTAEVYIALDAIRSVTGTENKYPKYGMFKKRVVEAAVAEVNGRLRYHLDYSEVKEGRKVVGYRFSVRGRAYSMMQT